MVKAFALSTWSRGEMSVSFLGQLAGPGDTEAAFEETEVRALDPEALRSRWSKSSGPLSRLSR